MGLMAAHDAERYMSIGLLCLARVACPHHGQILGHSMVHRHLEKLSTCIFAGHTLINLVSMNVHPRKQEGSKA